ncbi:MAG: SusD/RagB family nutrient-binding outer membrane lipoprotein [Chryseolinea sp.]
MRYKSKIGKAALCLAAVISPLAGCDTDDLHNLNVNPNAVSSIDMNFLFTAAELSTACNGAAGDNWYTNWRTNIGTCAYAIQQLSTTATSGIGQGDKYWENLEASQGVWDYYYDDQLKNLAEVIKQTGEGGIEEGRRKNTREAARILRVANFHRLTDWFGNIPYSEANQGVEGNFFPVYDKQQAIYADLLKELDEACANISTGNVDDGFAAADMIYQGDVAKWKKYGYTLMLRLAMRISNVDAANAASYVSKAVTGGVFTSNDDNAIVPMTEAQLWNTQNGITRSFVDGGQSTVLSKTFIDKLRDSADPRLMIISGGVKGDKTPANQKGMPNGLNNATLDEYTGTPSTVASNVFSTLNPLFLDRSEPYMLMKMPVEAEFLQAEAIERGIGTVGGTAAAHYAAGVKAAMQMYTINDATFTVSDAAVVTYLAAHPYAGTLDQKLELIGTQLWISKFLNWWDAWSDWRRSGHPTLTPVNYPGNLTNGQIPRKLKLPTSEYTRNPENLNSGATTPDTQVGKVWWDGGN